MADTISSRTPEGVPNRCPVCNAAICIVPSQPAGDAPCPNCGTLLWFLRTSAGIDFFEAKKVGPVKERIEEIVREHLPLGPDVVLPKYFIEDLGADSLDLVELIMDIEEEFDVSLPDEEARGARGFGDVLAAIIRAILRRPMPPDR
jgi:acyl carrier protein